MVKMVRVITQHGETFAPSPEGPQHLWTKEESAAVARWQNAMLELDKRGHQQYGRKE